MAGVVGIFESIIHAITPSSIDVVAFFLAVGWTVLGTKIIPGRTEDAKPKPIFLPNGQRVVYKLNGLRVYLTGIALYFGLSSLGLNLYPAAFMVDHANGMLGVALVWACAFTTYLYLKGIKELKASGKSEGFWMDFWCGTQLNPHVFGLNVKFLSYRPAFFFHHLINLSAMAKQYELYGRVSTPMLLYQLVNGAYIMDYFVLEDYVITTWDIIAERFGFMLVFGDYVWMGFFFPLNAHFLVHVLSASGVLHIALTLATFALGYTIFRFANRQKHKFKQNATGKIWGKPPVVITTPKGPLLMSGWWGVCRKINYTGDILLGVAYALPAGDKTIWVWSYAIYLTLLLLQRAHRDNRRCKERYGSYWDEYCKRVPYTLIPFVY